MKKIIIAVTITIMLSLLVAMSMILKPAEKYSCLTLSDMGESEQALKTCAIDANNGDAKAQYVLGWMYKYGQGVFLDYSKAKIWFEKAAKQGHTLSQSELADMYMNGLGVKQDYIQARIWYETAACQQNDPSYSAYDIGYIYENGLGIQIDLDKAILWYRAACDNLHHEGCEKVNQLSLPE